MRYLFLLVPALLLLFVLPAHARLDPDLYWLSAESAHFRVLFPTGYAAWGGRVLKVAEEAHQQLTADLGYAPPDKTTIVLADVSDLPNGMATPFPANLIILYLTPPQEEPFELTDREDWLRRLVIHEYTHILQLDQVAGVPAVLRRIFGRLYFPNAFQPNWLIEGLATWEETRQTAGGRGRAAYTDMLLRMAVLEGDFPTLAQAGVAPDRWPGGAVPYLFGVSFYQYLVARHGDQLPGAISAAYAGRALPLLIDATAAQVFASTYAREWSSWQQALTAHYSAIRQRVREQGVTPLHLLTTDGGENLAPAPSPDGRYLAWNAQNADQLPSLMVRDLRSGAERVLSRSLALPAEAGANWSADSRSLLFAQVERDSRDNLFGDLYTAHPDADTVVRTTTGLRTARPDRNPLSGEIACVLRQQGTTRLVLLDQNARQQTVLAAGDDGRLFFTPRWAPDGERLAVGVRDADGRFTLQLLDRQGTLLRQLPPWPGLLASPAWTPDGRYLLFTSDRDGIFNLYAWQPENDACFRVTNVLGGAFSPAPSADGRQLYLSSYSARGFDLAVMPLDPAAWQPLPPAEAIAAPAIAPTEAPLPVTTAPYTAWVDLRPRYWLPWVSADDQGVQLGLSTSGSDPLGRHSYAVTTLYGLASQRPAWSLLYQYDGLLPTLRATVADVAAVQTDFFPAAPAEDTDFWERRRSFSLDFDFPSAGLWSRWHLVPGLRLLRFDRLESTPAGYTAPPEGDLAGARLAWRFDNSGRPARAISPEAGRAVEVAAEAYSRELGSDFDLRRQSLDWREYLVLPGVRHQVLAPRLFAGLTQGDELPQQEWQAGGDVLGDLPTVTPESLSLPLRGYPTNSRHGRRIVLGSLEYRCPLLEIDDGIDNGALYFRRLHGALFAEGADLFDHGGPRLNRLRTAAGAELRLDAELGYVLPLTVRLVAAKGFDEGGEGQVYVSVWTRF